MKEITEDNFACLHQLKPRRIYLPTANVLKRYKGDPDYYGTLNFNFKETIQKIFEKDTGLNLFDNSKDEHNTNSVWLSIKNEDDYNRIESWIAAQETTVFIRSLLPLCIALDINVYYDKKIKTEIGKLENQAKMNECAQSISKLVDICCARIRGMSFYKDASYISAVPANKEKEFDLPTTLVKEIAERLKLVDVTHRFQYRNAKQTLKDASIEDKWQKLEESGLAFTAHRAKNATIILLDDKYQSGATMHYVASRLQQAGFDEIYGLTLVKTLRDADNQ